MSAPGDPLSTVDEILRFNQHRKRELVKIKFARMAENVFAFFRGTDHLFARHWPVLHPDEVGPPRLICGDLHLENFGAYQTDDRDFRYDVNDFDEALVAPCSLDLVRCTTSILLAAEVWNISPVQASGIALDFLTSYRAAVTEAVRTRAIGEIAPGQGDGPIWDLLDETALGVQSQLLDRHTEQGTHGARRIIRSDEKHPEISEKKAQLVREAVEAYGQATATPKAYRVLDVTGRIMGIGSCGLHRYTVLIAGGGTPDTNRLLDVKEAIPSSVLSCSVCPQPDTDGNDAVRIVRAQHQLQSKPTAGLAAIDIDARHYRMREMVPDENRSKLDRLHKKPDKLRLAVGVVGQLTAWSQLRGCRSGPPDAARQLAAWVGSPALDAVLPSAVRYADISCRDFQSFSEAYADHHFDKHLRE
ncbi:MAG: DUF2252 family protein [Planctomycetia bacterium]|nr:DUF2252 family protein [Planctomycetia bacterium]